jgi:transcriptional regulator with GAF, ATPase, and Fis domain
MITLRNALDKSTLIEETKTLRKKVSKNAEMIGDSPAIRKVKDMIERVAPTDARVLVTGENGTGKELVARYIHEKSNRNTAALIEVNCAAIPSELIESELFGHEKGAFTSAIKQRKGQFELAHGGTLFLDEIGDMSLSAQAKVLRALQENKITRVGGEKEISVDVRIIAATNKNLKDEIAKGNFREDLYHRLSVIIIEVPSLNDRIEDVPLLANHFLQTICNDYGIPVKAIQADAVKELMDIQWTGNIREFRNVVERLIILGEKEISKEDVISFARHTKQT